MCHCLKASNLNAALIIDIVDSFVILQKKCKNKCQSVIFSEFVDKKVRNRSKNSGMSKSSIQRSLKHYNSVKVEVGHFCLYICVSFVIL